jgi:hypothetical protein
MEVKPHKKQFISAREVNVHRKETRVIDVRLNGCQNCLKFFYSLGEKSFL